MPRPFPTHTPLGRIMVERGVNVARLSDLARVSPRTLTEYLAARAPFLPDHRARIADALNVNPSVLGPIRALPPITRSPSPPISGPRVILRT